MPLLIVGQLWITCRHFNLQKVNIFNSNLKIKTVWLEPIFDALKIIHNVLKIHLQFRINRMRKWLTI